MVSGTHTSFSHEAHCPEISPLDCADPSFEIEGRVTLKQWSDEAQIIQRFVGTMGLSYTPSGKER